MTNLWKNKKRRVLAAIALVLLLLLIIILFSLFKRRSVEAIDLSTLKKEEIVSWVEQNKLQEDVEIKYEFSNVIPEDELISQSIAAGNKVQKGFLIIISKGLNPDEEVELPKDYKNYTKVQLDEFFQKSKLQQIEYKYEHHDKIAKDKIISVEPASKIKRSAKIVVKISNGKEDPNSKEITIPDFKSYSKKNIELWAEKNKINLTFEEVEHQTLAAGSFISQSPVKLSKVKQGSRLVIKLSAGKRIVIPNLLNKSEEEIKKIASTNGFKVKFIYEYSNQNEKGISFDQDVAVGQSIKPTSFVDIKISKGKRILLDFDVNQDLAKLKKELQNKGLVVKEVKEFSDTIASGMLIRSTPSVNSKRYVDPSSVIVLTISKGTDKINLATNFINKTVVDVQEFVKDKLADTAFVATKSAGKYSQTIAKDKIIEHDSQYVLAKGFNYVISLGDFVQENSANTFNAKTENDVRTLINEANNLDAKVTFNANYSYNASQSCQWNDRELTCTYPKAKPQLPSYQNNPCGSQDQCTVQINEDTSVQVSVSYEFHDSVAKDAVIRQEPVSGTLMNNQDPVKIIISKGVKKSIITYRLTTIVLSITTAGVDANSDDLAARTAEFENSARIAKNAYPTLNVEVHKMIDTSIPAGKVVEGASGNTPNGDYEEGSTIHVYISIGKSE